MMLSVSKQKILIVDDAPTNIQVLVEILGLDYDIHVAIDGLDALEAALEHRPDLVLLDIEMPGLDGYEVCVRLKTNPDTKEIPIIFLTARDNDQDEAKGLSLGAIDYITKPFNPTVVTVRVRNQLELKRHRDAMERMARELGEAKEVAEEAKEVAEEASRTKSEFMATMSHEIRTPMNAIMGLTDLALQTELTPKGQDYLVKVAHASRSLMRIINDILDFSKIEAGKLQLEPVDFFLRDVFDHLADLFRNHAAERGIELILRIGDESRYALTGDYLRLEQVLMNLMSNALKFTEEGEIEVGVTATEQREGHVVLEFYVRDTGIGLSQAQMDGLFVPFAQADGSITRKYGGTGLGLSICKRLVEIMEGRIWVESTLGDGSLFRFTVALQRREAAEQNDLMPPEDLHGMRVLVVDDNPTTQNALRAILDVFTFETTVVDVGLDAVAAVYRGFLEGTPYQLVLVDWWMPELDGVETVRRIMEIVSLDVTQALPSPKIILLTDYDREEEIKQQARAVGVHAFLAKPVNSSLLFDTIMEVFGKELAKIYQAGRAAIDLTGIIEKIGGARILLVEDNVINQQVARETLENVGLFVAVAGDGLEATRMVLEFPFELVLMDIQMPRMDGYTACRQIRGYAQCKTLPIVAMTAHASASDRQNCLDAGMNDHVAKPIDRKQLYATLLAWIKPGDWPRLKTVVAPKKVLDTSGLHVPVVLPGINVAAGLERMGDNHRLFQTILFSFSQDFSNVVDKIRTVLGGNRGDDLESACRLIHTLKGTSGNISAQVLSNAARALEVGIKEGRRKDWSVLLDDLECALQQVLESIATLQAEEEKRQIKI